MVPALDLVRAFRTMYLEHWRYEWGSHERCCVDCSGAFRYAFEQHGISYPNGSNAIARKYVLGEKLPINMAQPGMAAFKLKTPAENGYDLPEKYKPGGGSYTGDLNDYYHIGLVDEDVNYVLNAKGKDSGFCRDALTNRNGWDCVAFLKNVDYGVEGSKGEMRMMKAKVVLPSGASGRTVNMREKASVSSGIIAQVPVGTEISVIDDLTNWCRISYNGKTGYMMSNYIEYDGQPDETENLTNDQRDTIDQALSHIEEYCGKIMDAVEEIGSIVGRG